jgi:hypothetical protein
MTTGILLIIVTTIIALAALKATNGITKLHEYKITQLNKQIATLENKLKAIDKIATTGGTIVPSKVSEREKAYSLARTPKCTTRYDLFDTNGKFYCLIEVGESGCTVAEGNLTEDTYDVNKSLYMSWEAFKNKFPSYPNLVWDWVPSQEDTVEMVMYTREQADLISAVYVEYASLLGDVPNAYAELDMVVRVNG